MKFIKYPITVGFSANTKAQIQLPRLTSYFGPIVFIFFVMTLWLGPVLTVHAQTLSIADAAEIGDENTGVVFTVTLTRSMQSDEVRARYRTYGFPGSTAIRGAITGDRCATDTSGPADYQHTSGTLIFTPGSTTVTRTITVPVCPDRSPSSRPYYTFGVKLEDVRGATITDGEAVGKIRPGSRTSQPQPELQPDPQPQPQPNPDSQPQPQPQPRPQPERPQRPRQPLTTPPSAPLNLTATPGYGEVMLNWQAPEDSGGSPVIGYEYRQRRENEKFDDTWTWVNGNGNTRETTVTGLENGVTYSFQVR